MRIAQIAPLGERVPPKKYGGTERFVHTLTEGLVERGHEVTLFASGDSETSAYLRSVYPKSLREVNSTNPYGAEQLNMLNILTAYKDQFKFDIIHDHTGYISLPTAALSPTPVVATLHGAASIESKKLFDGMVGEANPHFVSISYSQRRPLPDLNYVANIYHGLDVNDYPFSKDNDEYLLFVGRICAQKGVADAIEVAKYLDLPLIIAAKVDPEDQEYFEKLVKPNLSDKIRWIGEVDVEERNKLMSRALCFIHPVAWREPFGLTLIESMACGTPVVAFNRGSIPEIIKHGKTGFISEDVAEMIEHVKRIKEIKRLACRQHVATNFNSDKMVDEYEKVYKKLILVHSSVISKGNKTLLLNN